MAPKPKKPADFTTEITIPMTISKGMFRRTEVGRCTDPETGETFVVCINMADASYLFDMPDGTTCVLKADDLLNAAIAAWRGRKW